METHNRSSYPDSPHPSDWISKPYSIVFTGVVLFILIFGIAFFLGYRQIETTRHNALTADKTTANLLADLILEHNIATIGILQSYALRPLFIHAVKNTDPAEAYRQLADLKKNAEIDLTFVTDKRGILWVNFPLFPEALGKDLSYRDWYKGISSHWKPYISTVFKLIVGDKPLAVAVCIPIYDEKERVIGILASSQRLDFLVDTIERVPLSLYTAVNVIDRAGHILYSNNIPYRENITDYRFTPIIEAAIKEKKQQIEINDPQKGQDISYLTTVPIGDIGWTVIIERSERDIFHSEFRRFVEIGAVSFLLFLLVTFFLVYLRKVSLFRKTEELLQAEANLRQRDEKLRTLSSRHEAILAAVPEIIMEVDNNKIYTWANSVGIEFFGEDVIGKEAAFYFEGEQDTYDKVNPLLKGSEEIIHVESWQRRRDGEKRLLAWWCRVLKNEKGNVEGVLSSAYDITERKHVEDALIRSEQLLKDTQSISKIGGWEYDVEKKLLIWTDEVYRIYGVERNYDPNDIGKAISFYCEEDQQIIEKAFLNAIHTGKPYDLELQFNAADGTKKWVRTMGNPVLKDDKIIKVFGNINDITERKRAEEERRLFTEELERSNVDLQQFAYVASHDLQEPLRMISSYLQLIERRYQDKLDSDANDFIHYAVDGANRLRSLIDGLLEFSRIKTHGKLFESVDVMKVLDRVCRDLEPLIVESGATVRYGQMPMIQADEAQIVRLFQNLIQNALKFRREEIPPLIEITAEKTGGHHVFRVCDNGIGIEAPYFERIFIIFQRLHTREQYPGMGIGLSICKRIVERHRGTIWVDSTPDEGSSFCFSIPEGIQ